MLISGWLLLSLLLDIISFDPCEDPRPKIEQERDRYGRALQDIARGYTRVNWDPVRLRRRDMMRQAREALRCRRAGDLG